MTVAPACPAALPPIVCPAWCTERHEGQPAPAGGFLHTHRLTAGPALLAEMQAFDEAEDPGTLQPVVALTVVGADALTAADLRATAATLLALADTLEDR